MIFRTLACLATALAAVGSVPAYACSVAQDYVRPSNFELVQIADAIVIARAVGERRGGEDIVGSMIFETESALKGTPPRRLELDFAGLGRPRPSDLANLMGSHAEGHAGPCNRSTFLRGGRYLLFLGREEEGDWRQLDYPFSRVNEDYSGEDNAWMRSVRRYLALQHALPPMEQIAALRRIAETGRQADGTAVSAAERADVLDHLRSISRWKPTAWLLDVYGRLERGEAFMARPNAANRESGNLDEVAAFLLRERLPAGQNGPERLRLLVLGALAEGDHPEALPLIDRLSAAPETRGRTRGLVLRYLARNGQYRRAYEWIEERLLRELALSPRNEAIALLRDVADVQRGDSYTEGRERWRTDPHAAATWPELALALYSYQVRTFGAEHTLRFGDALDAIAVTDYRTRPDLAVALADDHSESVQRWAVAELARLPVRSADTDGEEEDPALFPLRLLATAWSEANVAALLGAFCQGGERRRSAIVAVGRWGDKLYETVLVRMAAATRPSDPARRWLIQAALEMTARDLADDGRVGWGFGEGPDSWLVSRLIRGETPDARPPLTCPAAS